MKMGSSRKAGVLVVAFTCALTIATYGGASGASGSKAPISIGLEGCFTGSNADIGAGMVKGATIAVDAINAAGGVLGRRVTLHLQDDAGDPIDAVPAAQTLINVNHVVAIMGPTSLTASVVLRLAAKANIPMLMFGGGSSFDAVTDPHFFRMSPSDSDQAKAMLLYAKSRGWTKAAIVVDTSGASQSLGADLSSAAKKMGISIVASVNLSVGATSYNGEIGNISSAAPQVLLANFAPSVASVFYTDLAQQGLGSIPTIGSNVFFDTAIFQALGATVASGNIYIANSATSAQLGVPTFLKLLKKHYGLTVPPNGAAFMYDAVNAWALGADAAGSTRWPLIRKGILKASSPPGTRTGSYSQAYQLLRHGKKINWEGAASTDDFNKFGNVFGPFDILRYDTSGNTHVIKSYSAAQVSTG